MNHDPLCELVKQQPTEACRWTDCNLYGVNRHCHCGSRAYRLCTGCKRGQHLSHQGPCECDLCEAA